MGGTMDVEELEARFKEIDALSNTGKIEVDLDRSAGPAASLRIDLNKKTHNPKLRVTRGPGRSFQTRSKETLLNIDLAQVNISDEYIRAKINRAISNPQSAGIPDVVLSEIGATGIYQLREDYTYTADANYEIEAKTGFTYDRASIPRIFFVFIDKDELSNVAPLFHDLLYKFKGVLPDLQVRPYQKFSREDSDKLFYEIMLKSGVKKWRAYLAYQAVRGFGQPTWNK
jgi:hypothetical protein